MEHDSITTTEAAEILGISPRRVRALVKSGALTPIGRLGSIWILDRRQLIARRRQAAGNQHWSPTAHTGRRWSEKTAWAAISLLDSLNSMDSLGSTLDAPALSRLRKRLGEISLDRLAWLAGGRARLSTFEGLPGDAAYLREEVAATGLQALSSDAMSGTFDLVAFDRDVDGYVSRERLPVLIAKYNLTPSPTGAFKLRTVSEERFECLQANGASATAVALDLLDDGAVRTRSQAERLLQARIERFGRKDAA